MLKETMIIEENEDEIINFDIKSMVQNMISKEDVKDFVAMTICGAIGGEIMGYLRKKTGLVVIPAIAGYAIGTGLYEFNKINSELNMPLMQK